MTHWRSVPAILAALALCAGAASAQQGAVCASPVALPEAAANRWPAPLDRIVSIAAEPQTLRAVIARLEADANVRFSYSPELVPLDRIVCGTAMRLPLGAALTRLLAGVSIAPVVAGRDQVVLAPISTAAGSDAQPEFARHTGHLERVVVTGTATGAAERASPFAVAVLERGQIGVDGTRSLAQLLDGAVPGLWLWPQAPTSPLARFGSMRGASSFGATTPKIYVDGIEVANPLLVSGLDASRIQSIEVIRGPQGAALYGADAISGVVNITTRRDGVAGDTPPLEIRASGGAAQSAFATGGVLAQDHGLVARLGSAGRAANLSASLNTIGAYLPNAAATQGSVGASGRVLTSRAIVSSTASFRGVNASAPVSPLLLPLAIDSTGTSERLRQYTVGTTVTIVASDRWTHALIAGIDGYRLVGFSADDAPVRLFTDSLLRHARSGADRLTLRASSTLRVTETERLVTSLTFGAEHSSARETRNEAAIALSRPPGATAVPIALLAPLWWSNTGALAQGRIAYLRTLYLEGGARAEQIVAPDGSTQVATLPILGAAVVRDAGAATIKFRGAFGRGIRPARSIARAPTWSDDRRRELIAPDLSPEAQSGTEAGVDLLWGRAMGLHVTRFDQRASGLIQPVAIIDTLAARDTTRRGGRGPGGGDGSSGGPPERHVGYQLQNLGAIDNRGWELQATTGRGPLSLSASLSIVDSRVRQLASGYHGDLRPGDRMLEVPARTVGLAANWISSHWTAGLTASRAFDWVNYDRQALAEVAANAAQSDSALVGVNLRNFWRTYPGVTRISARTAFGFSRGMWLTIAGENLLDRQLGEPENATVLPGRTVTIGVRTSF